MFNFFKKKPQKFSIVAPVTGILTDLAKVNDPVFSEKMMGDGFAIVPASSATVVCAPVAGKIVSLPDSKHAVGIVTDQGDEILLHIGIDTVNLKGAGFKALVNQEEKVSQGQKIIELDRAVFEQKKIDLTTMVIFTKLASDHQEWHLEKAFDTEVTEKELLIEK